MPSPVHLIGSPAASCRTVGCRLRAVGELGYCATCSAVYRAARALREQLLARRREQLRDAHRPFFDALSGPVRARLLAHMAAAAAHHGQTAHAFNAHGLEDFLSELRELGNRSGGQLR